MEGPDIAAGVTASALAPPPSPCWRSGQEVHIANTSTLQQFAAMILMTLCSLVNALAAWDNQRRCGGGTVLKFPQWSPPASNP
ncbi:hypothetical protein L226DRAFT_99407 [Lentinus tigrinus ALCF2SS1-7]|uniref:uncharacterized protein n=1 Tax=Lentinus tigrinus ALCF2SS1-7 TaxID=1328758 RepID=UPI0011661AC4|nr:hypothetical protein L226DRAFT_99407 [Lentinus tigrinus ALCF2SS1-7]